MKREEIEIGGFDSIVGGGGGSWMPGVFPTEDGPWRYQEPDAVAVLQDGALRVVAVPFTRHHDSVQILDNAKHMYFSTARFGAPEGGVLTLEWEQSARIVGARPGDLYDGFVSFHLLDLSRGVAANVFVGNDLLSPVYARLPFPGAEAPPAHESPRYFAWFDEREGLVRSGELHRYAIRHDRGADALSWSVDGEEIKRVEGVVPCGPFHLALGLMTEKDILPGKGSVSCHGQGAIGTWGGIRAVVETP